LFGVDLDPTVYALDSTTIDLCLSLCPWALFQRSRGAVKQHTLLSCKCSASPCSRKAHSTCFPGERLPPHACARC